MIHLFLSAVEASVHPEEQILNCDQPDMEDCGASENMDEEADPMLEELPSGILHFFFGMLI